jgi:hypothetical protein
MFKLTPEEITYLETLINDFEPEGSEDKHIISCRVDATSKNFIGEKTYDVTIRIGMFPGE